MEQQQQQHQQNEFDGTDIISQEDRASTNTTNVRQRKKWTKEMNVNIIRCYFNTTQRRPNQTYRKEFFRRWKEIYPSDISTEQRVCDQRAHITKRAETNNIGRGNWLTSIEIGQIRNQIIQEVANETIPDQDEGDEQQQQANELEEENVPEQRQQQQQRGQLQPQPQQLENQEMDNIKQQLIDEYTRSILTPFGERHFIKKPGKREQRILVKAVTKVNRALEDMTLLTEISDVTTLNNLVYAAAITSIKNAALGKQCLPRKQQKYKKKQKWQVNFKNRIDNLRTEINKIVQMTKDNQSAKMKKNSNTMKNKYKIDCEEKRQSTLETLRQRLKVLNNRLSRYTKREKQFQQNRDFFNKPSKMFDELRGNRITIENPPQEEEVTKFWRPLFETKKTFNQEAMWLPEYKQTTNEIIPASYTTITVNEVEKATSSFANWKSPGVDKLHNFWWKKLSCVHTTMATTIDNIMRNPETCPTWLTTGRTTLVAKKKETQNPSNYRPITCLPIIYKIQTSIVTSRMNHHITANNIIPAQQKGNSCNTFGTIDQLLINKMIQEDARTKKKNLSTAWIDYKKAFDSVPHDWIVETLKIHKFDKMTTNFIEMTMKQWKTSLNLTHSNGEISTPVFDINTGIFQGDSPSGLIFILCLLPLSWLLERTRIGYKVNRRAISHLIFMDDLKLFASNDNQLRSLINVTKTFSDDIKMCFGMNKCNKITIVRGKVVHHQTDITLNTGEVLTSLENEQQYRYLGFNEREKTDKTTKSTIKNEYFKRIKMIMKSELNSQNTINAINIYAVPFLAYGIPVLDWTVTELEIVDRETRKVLQQHHSMHIQSDVTRLYIPRRHGGRGLINICDHYRNAIINFDAYLLKSEEDLLKMASEWQTTRGEKSIRQRASRYSEDLGEDLDALANLGKQQRKTRIKEKRVTIQLVKLSTKELHGQHARLLQQPEYDADASNRWLQSSTLKRATESMICAIQEQAITTRHIQRRIHQTTTNDQCRLCRRSTETIHHIISGCTVMAPTKYLQRHDNVCKYVHDQLLLEYGFKESATAWYQHQPRAVEENEKVKILWNFSVQTDHAIQHNKPDIIVIDKRTKVARIIDIAIPNDNNICRKRFDKIRAYTDLAVEIKTLWGLVKVDIVPIIIGATGTMYNNLEKDIEKLTLERVNFDKFHAQKITLLGTAHIVRGFLQIA